MTCRWKDKHWDNLYHSFIPEVEGLPLLKMGIFQNCNPVTRGSGNRGDQLTRVLCFTSTVAMYMNGSPTFVLFTSATRW